MLFPSPAPIVLFPDSDLRKAAHPRVTQEIEVEAELIRRQQRKNVVDSLSKELAVIEVLFRVHATTLIACNDKPNALSPEPRPRPRSARPAKAVAKDPDPFRLELDVRSLPDPLLEAGDLERPRGEGVARLEPFLPRRERDLSEQ